MAGRMACIVCVEGKEVSFLDCLIFTWHVDNQRHQLPGRAKTLQTSGQASSSWMVVEDGPWQLTGIKVEVNTSRRGFFEDSCKFQTKQLVSHLQHKHHIQHTASPHQQWQHQKEEPVTGWQWDMTQQSCKDNHSKHDDRSQKEGQMTTNPQWSENKYQLQRLSLVVYFISTPLSPSLLLRQSRE